MLSRLLAPALLLAWVPMATPAAPQPDTGAYRIVRPHPRLLLPARRLRLLARERERNTMRWEQFHALVAGGAEFPEPGFAHALYYVASGDAAQGRKAVEWALADGVDTRQLAIVFDWCQELLSEAESSTLAAKLAHALDAPPNPESIEAVRDRVFAAIAVGGHIPDAGEVQLRSTVANWWRGHIVPEWERGGWPIPRRQTYPLIEILHAVRDNTLIDLRTDYRPYFASFAAYALLTYYPAVYPAAGNDFRIPLIEDGSEPDLRDAALSRAADLAAVAYDPNALEIQFLQGWMMFDQFLMRGTFGIPYEFLWANPYQPGLSYYSAPTAYHDPASGRLAIRSSWDGDARWFYHAPGLMQTFEDGRIVRLDWGDLPVRNPLGESIVVPLRDASRFEVSEQESCRYYLIGLDPHRRYDVEVDDEGLAEHTADAGGIIVIEFPAGRVAAVRLHPTKSAVAGEAASAGEAAIAGGAAAAAIVRR